MAKIVNEHQAESLSRTLSGGARHYPTADFWSSKLKVGPCSGHVGHCPVGSLKNAIFSQNQPLSSQVSFLSYSAPNRMKFGHKGHLNTRNKFPKEVFPKSNDFSFDFG
jgi:hypothetical protein